MNVRPSVRLSYCLFIGLFAVATMLTACDSSDPNRGEDSLVANAGPDQTVQLGTVVTLEGSLSANPGGGTFTYAWTVIAEPQGSNVQLSSTTTAKPSFSPVMGGSHVFQLEVSADGATDADQVTISVQQSVQSMVIDENITSIRELTDVFEASTVPDDVGTRAIDSKRTRRTTSSTTSTCGTAAPTTATSWWATMTRTRVG